MTNRRRCGDFRPAHGAGGFTIVELIIAMMLIVVLAGIAMPYIDVAEFRVRGAAQSVGTTLLAAQRLAVKEQHDIVVAVDPDGRLLRLHEDENNDGVRDEGERVRHSELGDGIVFGRGGAPARAMGAAAVELDGRQDGLPAITFHRDGSASEEGGFYLTSELAERTGDAEHTWAIEIERSTGRVNWSRYQAPRCPTSTATCSRSTRTPRRRTRR